MIQKGRTGGDQFKTSAATDLDAKPRPEHAGAFPMLSFAKTASVVVLSGCDAFIAVMETTYLRDFDNSPSA
jgi:hypothetical protein